MHQACPGAPKNTKRLKAENHLATKYTKHAKKDKNKKINILTKKGARYAKSSLIGF
jgi:hypothetical protein